MARHSPLGALARGLAAGVVATGAMTGYQLLVARLRSQDEGGEPASWEEAPAPAQVGKRIVSGLFHRQVGLDRAGLLANTLHWAYGVGCGGVYGLVQETVRAPPLKAGAGFGTGVWALSYAQLVPMGIYRPPWKYPPQELALDLSYHLVYGSTAAVAYAALARFRAAKERRFSLDRYAIYLLCRTAAAQWPGR